MDQNVILVETVPLEFDLESLGCRLRIRPGQTKFMDRLSRLAEEAVRVARPKAVARLCGLTILDEEKVQVGEVIFSSPLLRQKMDGLGRPFPIWRVKGRNWPTGAFPFLPRWSRYSPVPCGKWPFSRLKNCWKGHF